MMVRTAPLTHRRLVLKVVVLALFCAGLTGAAASVWFTGTRTPTTPGNGFTIGTVKLSATPGTTAITFANMAPGDKLTAPITVTNTGTVPQRYSVLSTTDAPDADFLAAQLDLTIKTGVGTCDNKGFTLTGTAVYRAADLGSVAGTKLIGDSAPGAQAGDRTLATEAREVLCAQILLPLHTGASYQARTTTATLTFNAEQIVDK